MSHDRATMSELAFTPAIKALQARKGSRALYARVEKTRPWLATIPLDLARFIEAQTSFFLGTANAAGQPYIQHRGGPPGFLRVLDERTLGFADFLGNRQYITQGNLAENPKACLFLIDYRLRQRVKIWGEARVLDASDELGTRLMPMEYRARLDQAILFSVAAWDANCPQHIPQRFEAAELADRDQRIASLEAENAQLRKALSARRISFTPAPVLPS